MAQRYILVHGAWHGAWCWDKLIPQLTKAGHQAIAIDLPSHGQDKTPAAGLRLQHYVDKVVDAIDSHGEPVFLVGHSLAGITVSGVTERRPDRIKALVFLDAVIVGSGQSYPEFASEHEPSIFPVLAQSVEVSSDGTTSTLRLENVKDIFYADCNDEDVARAKRLLGPEPLGPRGETQTLTHEGFGQVPKIYIDCMNGKVFTPTFKKAVLDAIPCQKIYTLPTSHSPFLSAPEELAQILMDI